MEAQEKMRTSALLPAMANVICVIAVSCGLFSAIGLGLGHSVITGVICLSLVGVLLVFALFAHLSSRPWARKISVRDMLIYAIISLVLYAFNVRWHEVHGL